MAAFPFLGPVWGFMIAPAAPAVREIIFHDTQLRLRESGRPAALWRRDPSGRLACRWVRPAAGAVPPH